MAREKLMEAVELVDILTLEHKEMVKEEEYLSQCTEDLKEKENREGREEMMSRKDILFLNFQKENEHLGCELQLEVNSEKALTGKGETRGSSKFNLKFQVEDEFSSGGVKEDAERTKDDDGKVPASMFLLKKRHWIFHQRLYWTASRR